MSVESASDTETTGMIQRVEAPLPPYAEQIAAVLQAAPVGDSGLPGLPRHAAGAGFEQMPVQAPEPPAGATVVPAPSPTAIEVITCPSCGSNATVTLNRRESDDFCRTCDFPLFWTPSKIVRGDTDNGEDSLRRLPGTVGRATVASLACPTCFEPNALSAQNCVRCGGPMHPVAEVAPLPPPPAPVVYEPPAAEPEPGVAWWVWVMLGLGAAALLTLIVLITTHTIG